MFLNVFEFQVRTSFQIYIEEQKQIVNELTFSRTGRPVEAETSPKRIIRPFSVRFSSLFSFFKQNIGNEQLKCESCLGEARTP
jgi:hypothetical protein